jgi:glutathione S-transferase
MPHELKVISFDLCPYVERSRIVLLEKGMAHQVEYIDLRNKPPWFLAVSPMGRVPVLLVDGKPIFESMVINELLEELVPAPSLFPAEPLARAEARGWIVFCNDALMPPGGRAMLALAAGRGGEALSRPLGEIRDAFGKLEAALGGSGGPYFLGKRFTLVDAAYAPFFRRWKAAEEWGGEEARRLGDHPRLAAYAAALLAHPSVVLADPGDVGPRSRRFYAERAAAGA